MRKSRIIFLFVILAGCNQNMEVVRSGEMLDDPSAPRDRMQAEPLAIRGNDGEREVPPFVRAYFMHTWVEALYSFPQNRNPNPNWESPLTDPNDGRVWCTDCHVSRQVDFERIPKVRMPLVEELENDKEFMADLMKKWVARLNSEEYFAKEKLKQPVTCLTCHATNPEL